MSDEAFLQAIVTEPDDDAPRLIYADWLEEHGDPDRATFIRIQIALAGMRDDDPRWAPLAAQEMAFLKAHLAAWAAPFSHIGAIGVYRRGFAEAVTCEARAFVKHAEELFARVPVLRLCLRGDADLVLPEVLACPSLTRLQSLNLAYNPLGDAGVGRIARCPRLTDLEVLDLSHTAFRREGARQLAFSPYLNSLKELWVGENPGLTELARALLRHRFGRRVQF